MRQNNQKDRKYRPQPLKEPAGHKKWVLAPWHIIDFQPNDLSTLESMHRSSWRRYVTPIALVFLVSGSSLCLGLAENKSASAASSANKQDSDMVSKEGELKIEDIKLLNEDGEESKDSAVAVSKTKESHLTSVEKKKIKKVPGDQGLKGKKVYKPKIYMAQLDPSDAKMKGVVRHVAGKMTAKSPNGLAVEYQIEKKTDRPREMWLNFVSGMEVSGAKSLDEIKEGDTVKITFKESKDGSKRILQGVELIKHKPPEKEEPEVGGEKAPAMLMDKSL